MDNLAPPLPARADEVFQILWEEFPSAREIPGDQAPSGDPVLDCADANLENPGDIAVGIHRLKGQVLDGEDRLQ